MIVERERERAVSLETRLIVLLIHQSIDACPQHTLWLCANQPELNACLCFALSHILDGLIK